MNLAGFYKALPAFHCFLIAVAFSLAAVRFFILGGWSSMRAMLDAAS